LIAEKIWQGQVVQRSFTIPEGWSLRQMAATLKISVFFRHRLSGRQARLSVQYPWLPADLFLEGFLILTNSMVIRSPQSIVQQMLNRFEVALLYQQGQNQTQLDLRQ